jgi:hypothetical protein
MKAYGGVYIDPRFVDPSTSWEWSASRPGRFTPGERALSTHWIGGGWDPEPVWMTRRREIFLTLPGLELQPLYSPADSESLYRLHYPGSYFA